MSDVTLGKLIDETAQRDAIHIAIAPVIASQSLMPGEHCGLIAGSDNTAGGAACTRPIGIVDPFLTQRIEAGERFYLFLYPQTVTGMRHHWSHPAFATAPAGNQQIANDPEDKHRRVIEDAGKECGGFDYDDMMGIADEYANHGEYYHMGQNERYKNFERWDDFWNAYTAIRGCKAPEYASAPFSCSC